MNVRKTKGTGEINENLWHLNATLDGDNGYMLENIEHNFRSFAENIRIERIYVRSKERKVKSFSLSKDKDVSVKIPPAKFTNEKQTPFGCYPVVFALATTFETIEPLFGKESQKLELTQEYIFTDYCNSPAHEPSGILPAARFYPLLRFKYPNAKPDKPSTLGRPLSIDIIQEIRVDYRLHFKLDLLQDYKLHNKPIRKNQAGVFRDQDEQFSKARAMKHPSLVTSPITNIFAAAEKPLVYEIVGEGIRFGSSDECRRGDWDNIHQWPLGLMTPLRPDLPFTPGTPHAVHHHWRWGYQYTIPTKDTPAAGPIFAGTSAEGKPNEAGAPMLDPLIPNQSLRFAVTTLEHSEEVSKSLTKIDQATAEDFDGFDKLFTRGHKTPAKIKDGADLVTWISLIASRRNISDNQLYQKEWSGTLFAHGVFFAHEPEYVLPPNMQSHLLLIGAKDEIYKPDKHTPEEWVRPKKGKTSNKSDVSSECSGGYNT